MTRKRPQFSLKFPRLPIFNHDLHMTAWRHDALKRMYEKANLTVTPYLTLNMTAAGAVETLVTPQMAFL